MEKQIEALRAEINSANEQMILGLCVIVVLMVAAYVVAVLTGKDELYKLIPIFSLTLVFFVARQDYMIHRAGAFIQHQELRATKYPEGMSSQDIQSRFGINVNNGWESWKSQLRSRVWLLPPLDILSGVAILYILVYSQTALWQNHSRFVIATSAGIIVGIVAIPVVTILAGK